MMTKSLRKEDVDRRWVVIDAKGQVLGRLASQVATILRGKHKPNYTPHVDNGDHVIVINAAEVRLTGRKAAQKSYFRHSGWPGGERFEYYADLKRENPEKIIRHAVRGMLPKNSLGRRMAAKLKVYAGADHPHGAQKPTPLSLPHRA